MVEERVVRRQTATRANEVLKAGEMLPLDLGVRTVAESRDRLQNWIGRLLSRFGFHDYRLIELVGSFGAVAKWRRWNIAAADAPPRAKDENVFESRFLEA